MRGLVQRVTRARVTVDGEEVGAIGSGLCVLIGVTHDDDEDAARKLADKIWGLRVFDDADGRMNLALGDVEGAGVLVVSQFTLYADTRKGRRPSYVDAARPELAEPLIELVGSELARPRCHRRHRALPGRHGGRAGQRRPRHHPARDLMTPPCRRAVRRGAGGSGGIAVGGRWAGA